MAVQHYGKKKSLSTQPAFWLIWVLVGVSAVLSLTGRYDWLPHYDLVVPVQNAHAFITEGTLPAHNGISGLYCYDPPGISYGFIPGMLLFDSCPDLAEKFGALLMSLICLIGMYVWIKPRLGNRAAILSMLIYWVSDTGVFYQTSLWPRAHPAFYVWFLLFLTLWVEKRKGVFLSGAALVFALGAYWFMGITPAVLLLPAVYYLYRPPICWKSMLVAVAIGTMAWMPFLRFEAGHGFSDMRAQMTNSYVCKPLTIDDVVYDKANKTVDSRDVPALKAKASIEGKTGIQQNEEKSSDGFWLRTREWGKVWAQHEERVYLGERGFVFYCTPLDSWAFQSVETGRLLLQGKDEWEPGVYPVDFPNVSKPEKPTSLTPREIKKKIIEFAPFHAFGASQGLGFWIWHMCVFVIAFIIALFKSHIFRRALMSGIGWWDSLAKRKWAAGNPDDYQYKSKDPAQVFWVIILIAIVIPVAFLCLFMDKNEMGTASRRFMWLWMPEAVLMGCILAKIHFYRLHAGLAIGAALVITLFINPRATNLFKYSFDGVTGIGKSNEQKAIDALAAIMEAEGKKSAYIGYDINLPYWVIAQHRLCPDYYKSGMEWDTALKLKYGITNLETVAEGISPKDEYVIFDPNYEISPTDFAHYRWNMTVDGRMPEMEKIADAGRFQILENDLDALQ